MEQLKQFAEGLPRPVKETGKPAGEADDVILKAGSLRMILNEGYVRHITSGRAELIRMIYAAVRTKEWLTIPPSITDLKIDRSSDSFRVSYRSRYQTGKIDFAAEYLISGSSDSSLSFDMKGKALTTFPKNRIGFCVLHPVEECAGKPCTIIHTGGSREVSRFPELISPHQPFRDIRSMQWQVAGLKCRLEFEGDIFETEDQRNWTDASFKTYCTPLDIPFPVTIYKGQRVSQRIEFKVSGEPDPERTEDDAIKITVHRDKTYPIPAIGIGQSTRPEPLTANEIGILKHLKLDHYRVDLHLFDPDWKARAKAAAAEAEMLGYPVELALFFDDRAKDQCNDLISRMTQLKSKIAIILLYHKTSPVTPDELTDTLTPILKKSFPGIRIASGTNANFAQLNRNRPQSEMADFICYSIQPQEHASDNLTLVENLKSQEYTVESCKMFSGKKGVWVSPVNIRRRFNANTNNYETRFTGTGMPPQVDSRLMSLLGASWIAGSIKYLCESGASGITILETAGERGIFQGDYRTRWPGEFKSEKGMIFPVFHVLNYILRHKNHRVVKSTSSDPLSVDVITLSDSVNIKAIVNNFTNKVQSVLLPQQYKWVITNHLNGIIYSKASCNPSFTGNSTEETYIKDDLIKIEPWSLIFIDGLLKY